MSYKKLQKFNINNPQHLEILRFICRWKYVSPSMIIERFSKASKTHIYELIELMIKESLIRSINSELKHCKGRRAIFYTPTYQGIKQANLPYRLDVSPRKSIITGKHIQNCIKVLNLLNLKENEYFTEQELWIRFKAFVEEHKLKTKPRFCDFAYIKDGKFIGVEVENHIKNYKEYVSEDYDPRVGPEFTSTLKKDKLKWGYFEDEHFYATILETRARTLVNAKKDALDAGVSAKIVNDKNKFGLLKKYRITFQNKDHLTLEGLSINQVKKLVSQKWYYGHLKIVKGELVKGSDCIFHRLMYGINQGFYNEVHWYFPEGLDKLFNTFIEKLFAGGYDHSFFKVFSFKEDNKLEELKLDGLTERKPY